MNAFISIKLIHLKFKAKIMNCKIKYVIEEVPPTGIEPVFSA